MLNSNCRQTLRPDRVRPDRRPTSMQRLTPGSVVCFGSSIDHEFCLDTAFVVASAEPWVPTNARTFDLSEAFIVCTADTVAAGLNDAHPELTLYRGATVDEPIDGMFSFAPALKAVPGPPRFSRPPIRIPELINPANWRGTLGSNRPRHPEQVRDAWRALTRQVFESELVLGVSFATPVRQDGQSAPPPSARSG
jgi:hypothetical protein